MKLDVNGNQIKILNAEIDEYISLTDIARYKNSSHTDTIIQNWLRNRNTIELLGFWEAIYNPNFKPLEFEGFKKQAGLNSFVLTPKRWIEKTNAIGIISKPGRYGGTYAHKDIAFEFASWISIEFKLYLIKEFQRLKQQEQQNLGWTVKRELAKINYRIHTDAIQRHLIPKLLTKKDMAMVYANEADVLNMALFGKTAQQWRDENPDLKGDALSSSKGNIRDYAHVNELICLSNLENINALYIEEDYPQNERLKRLNEIAIHQMKILTKSLSTSKGLGEKGKGE